MPLLVSLSARFAATSAPFFLRRSIAFVISPPASVRAFLQSIIPMPVFFRNSWIRSRLIFSIGVLPRYVVFFILVPI